MLRVAEIIVSVTVATVVGARCEGAAGKRDSRRVPGIGMYICSKAAWSGTTTPVHSRRLDSSRSTFTAQDSAGDLWQSHETVIGCRA